MSGSAINLADIAIVAVLLISGLFAYVRGFVHELLAVIAWIGAGFATVYGIDLAIPIARQITDREGVAEIAAGATLFLLVLIVLTIGTRIVARRIQASSLNTLDRTLGLVFGLVRGAVLVCLAWLVVSWAVPPRDLPDWIVEARSLPLVDQGKSLLLALVPEDLRPREADPLEGVLPQGETDFEDLIRPLPKATGPEEPKGYKDPERRELDRLIESAQ